MWACGVGGGGCWGGGGSGGVVDRLPARGAVERRAVLRGARGTGDAESTGELDGLPLGGAAAAGRTTFLGESGLGGEPTDNVEEHGAKQPQARGRDDAAGVHGAQP